MNVERLGRLARILRVRQRLTQSELSARAGVSKRSVSMLERGLSRRLPLGTVESVLGALGARVDLRVFWNGPELDRLLDAGHAALAASVKRQLERWGWLVRVEASYSRFGERGRIDLLAFHTATGTVVVIEIKTELVDVQELLGSLDVKARLAPSIAREFGWEVRATVPAIVFMENRTTRNRLARVMGLFDRYTVPGRAATTWLRRPGAAPTGLLWFTAAPAHVPSRSAAARVRSPGGGSRHDLKSDRPAAH